MAVTLRARCLGSQHAMRDHGYERADIANLNEVRGDFEREAVEAVERKLALRRAAG